MVYAIVLLFYHAKNVRLTSTLTLRKRSCIAVDHRRLWSESGRAARADGSVGDVRFSAVHVCRSANDQQRLEGSVAEQRCPGYQPRRARYTRAPHTECEQ